MTGDRRRARNLERPINRSFEETTPTLLHDAAMFRDHIAQPQIRLGKRAMNVAAFLADNPMEAAFGGARSIARLCGVSPPTVLRLARALGFENYAALRELFRRPLRTNPVRTASDLEAARRGAETRAVAPLEKTHAR